MAMKELEDAFVRLPHRVDHCALRYLRQTDEVLTVARGIPRPTHLSVDEGIMFTVFHQGAFGYAATSDLSRDGLQKAYERAILWADRSRAIAIDYRNPSFPVHRGTYATPVKTPWDSVSLKSKLDRLHTWSERLKTHEHIIDWTSSLWRTHGHTLYLTRDGTRIEQDFEYLSPDLSVTAHHDGDTQTRSLGGRGQCQQGGLEVLDRVDIERSLERLPEEALTLLSAPQCPEGEATLLLAPDQMMLQIHESIGHPLELDRILGDERNYAGTSFVTEAMFGSYQYGSELLNVAFDPSLPEEFASYGFDDDGAPAQKTLLIENGILKHPLGGHLSGARSGMHFVANSRAQSWNRPPIDRMANLNVEPGTSTFNELVQGIERGVYMETNRSWSIDDSRNKFQFGCEYGRLIENGELKHVVKNPNYRGISSVFWRALDGLGDGTTFGVYGTPYCGKGEPNQIIRVGHASPVARFRNVSIFGGH